MHTVTVVGFDAHGNAEALPAKLVPNNDYALFGLNVNKYKSEHPSWVQILINVTIEASND